VPLLDSVKIFVSDMKSYSKCIYFFILKLSCEAFFAKILFSPGHISSTYTYGLYFCSKWTHQLLCKCLPCCVGHNWDMPIYWLSYWFFIIFTASTEFRKVSKFRRLGISVSKFRRLRFSETLEALITYRVILIVIYT